MITHVEEKKKRYFLVYDKALWLYAKIFLEQLEVQQIKNSLIINENYQYVYLDPDIDQRRQLTNKICIVTEGDQNNMRNYDCFLKKSVDFL